MLGGQNDGGAGRTWGGLRGPGGLEGPWGLQAALWAYVFQCLGASDLLSLHFLTIWASGRSELTFFSVSAHRAL